jgi:hypothetical protein
VIGEDDDLENVSVYRFAKHPKRRAKNVRCACADDARVNKRRGQGGQGDTHKPSPSSDGSAETSNVIHPSGRSSVTARTSCRSPGLVPARTESAAGV